MTTYKISCGINEKDDKNEISTKEFENILTKTLNGLVEKENLNNQQKSLDSK